MREAILALLQTLPPDRCLEIKGDSAWIKCPIHSGGQERTPSYKISLEGQYAGCSFCFGCSASGGWKKTVTTLGFPSSAKFIVDGDVTESFSEDEEAAMLGHHGLQNDALIFESNGLTAKIGAEYQDRCSPMSEPAMIVGGDGMEPLLRLPAMMRGQERGYIDCKVRPSEDEHKKYINSRGSWSRDTLYPFDFVSEMDPDVLALVEGPRDALVTIRNGLPALATLGSTSWSERCVNGIMSIAPKTLMLLLDPDDAGDILMRRVYRDLSERMHVVPVRLRSKMIDGRRIKLEDPATLSKERLTRVCEMAGVEL